MRSAVTIAAIIDSLNSIAPFSLAEDWDNVGLQIGQPDTPVAGILIGLDPTSALIDEAHQRGCNLVICHHPLIFPAAKAIRTDQPLGACITKALHHHISLICCHTNLDLIPQGVSHALAQRLGLQDLTPLVTKAAAPDFGFGLVGTLAAPIPGLECLRRLCAVLDTPAVTVAGTLPDTVQRLALCGGSGSDFAVAARHAGAHLYVTAEVKHHTARWAEEAGFCLVDAGHFPSEHLISQDLAAMLRQTLASQPKAIPVLVTDRQKQPFSFFTTENDQQPSNERYGH